MTGAGTRPFVQTLFDVAVGAWGWTPDQFWRCRPGDFWWTFRAKMPEAQRQKPRQNAELYRLLKDAKAKEQGARTREDG